MFYSETNKLLRRFFNGKNHSYRKKITVIILIFALLPLIILGPVYLYRSFITRSDAIRNNNKEELKNAITNINNIQVEASLKVNFISENPYLFNLLTTDYKDMDNVDIVMSQYQIVRGIFQSYIQASGNDRRSINVYAYNKSVFEAEYSQSINNLDPKIRKQIEGIGNGKILQKIRAIADTNNKISEYLCFYKLISSMDSKVGVVELRIPFKRIVEAFANQVPLRSFIAYIPQGANKGIIIKSDNITKTAAYEELGKYIFKGMNTKYFIIESKTFINSDRIVMFIPRAYVFNEIKGGIIFNIFILIFAVTAIIFAVNFTSVRITKRLESLLNLTNKQVENLIENEDFTLLEGDDEFSQIDKSFCNLITKVKEYYEKVTDYELDNKNLELLLLQDRINPHLLYNTLSAIKWAFPDESLGKLVDALVKYYRISLNKGNEILKIDQEIEMIKEYIKIQKFVYISNFEVIIDIDPRIKKNMILKHTLQPIVENGIIHGVNALKSGGKISIKGELGENKIKFTIVDNGPGINQSQIDQILSGNLQPGYGGYGISNVIRRLSNHFGDRYSISIESTIGKGTIFTIAVPVLEA